MCLSLVEIRSSVAIVALGLQTNQQASPLSSQWSSDLGGTHHPFSLDECVRGAGRDVLEGAEPASVEALVARLAEIEQRTQGSQCSSRPQPAGLTRDDDEVNAPLPALRRWGFLRARMRVPW